MTDCCLSHNLVSLKVHWLGILKLFMTLTCTYYHRAMAVLEPLKVTIENFPNDHPGEVEVPNFPADDAKGFHKVFIDRVVYIEQSDFKQVRVWIYLWLFSLKECADSVPYNTDNNMFKIDAFFFSFIMYTHKQNRMETFRHWFFIMNTYKSHNFKCFEHYVLMQEKLSMYVDIVDPSSEILVYQASLMI